MPRKPKIEVFVGFKINRLTLIEFMEPSIKHDGKRFQRRPMALWMCECGKEFVARISHVVYGDTVACGCYAKDINAERKTHGLSSDPLYGVYHGMKCRCLDSNRDSYKYYGGRGIKICDRWIGEHGFENFYSDMAPRPSDEHEIERVDVNKDYCPENCVWIHYSRQAANKSSTVWCVVDGIQLCQQDFARLIGVNRHTIAKKRRLGWTPEQIRDHFAQRKAA